VGELLALPQVSLVFDSSRIPGEIMDLMVLNTAVLRANPDLGRALVGAWYETLGILFARNEKGTAALTAMAKASGTTLADLRSQLATTRMFISSAQAHGLMSGASLSRTMELVRAFSFTHNLLGAGAKNVDSVGIQFPSGNTLGDPRNVKLRFNATYTQLAADGKL
jgi:NitT/TauT family transport system substrate-binding protein